MNTSEKNHSYFVPSWIHQGWRHANLCYAMWLSCLKKIQMQGKYFYFAWRRYLLTYWLIRVYTWPAKNCHEYYQFIHCVAETYVGKCSKILDCWCAKAKSVKNFADGKFKAFVLADIVIKGRKMYHQIISLLYLFSSRILAKSQLCPSTQLLALQLKLQSTL